MTRKLLCATLLLAGCDRDPCIDEAATEISMMLEDMDAGFVGGCDFTPGPPFMFTDDERPDWSCKLRDATAFLKECQNPELGGCTTAIASGYGPGNGVLDEQADALRHIHACLER